MSVRLAIALAILLMPMNGSEAQSDVEVADLLSHARAAYLEGDLERALTCTENARAEILHMMEQGEDDSPLNNIRVLSHCLRLHQAYMAGRRPDLDAQADAALTLLFQLRQAYAHRDGPQRHLQRVTFDIDGRVKKIGEVEFGYAPFSNRLDELGSIEIDYKPFDVVPREIGNIEFRWVFDELWEIDDVSVTEFHIPKPQ